MRGLALVVGMGIVVSLFTSNALTASNTGSASAGGEGAAVISGYNVRDVHHHLNAVNPDNLDSVTFTLDETPTDGSTIKIRLVSGDTSWYSCTTSESPAIVVTCPTTSPQATVAASDELTVVAAV